MVCARELYVAMDVPREPRVKSHQSKTSRELRAGKSIMAVQRKRFRIEEAIGIDTPAGEAAGGDIGPMHNEIMSELRAIRAQMGKASAALSSVATEAIEGS